MSITASALYRDTGNFLRHQFATIVLISLLAVFITLAINHIFIPEISQLTLLLEESSRHGNLLDTLQGLTPEQQLSLWQTYATGAFASLLGNALLVGSMLTLIAIASAGKRASALRVIAASAPLLPRLLILLVMMILTVQIGFIMVILPGFVLAFLLSLAPVLMVAEKKGIFAAMLSSVRLAWQQKKLVAPALIIWLLANMAALVLVSSLTVLPADIASLVFNTFSHFFLASLIVYLYRLYMLLRQSSHSHGYPETL